MTRILKPFVLLVLTGLHFTSTAQADNTQIINYYPGTKLPLESYYIQLPDSTKHGPYQKFSREKILLQSGQYNRGKKHDIWNYYENTRKHRVKVQYDFTLNKEVIFNYLTIAERKAYITLDGNNTAVFADQNCHFPGGMQLYEEYVQEQLRMIPKEILPEQMVQLYIHFTIDAKGKVRNLLISEGSIPITPDEFEYYNAALDKHLKDTFEKMPLWKPIIFKGTSYANETPYCQVINIGNSQT